MKTSRIVISFAVLALLMSSCNKSISYESLHEKVIGSWSVAEVTFRQEGTMQRKDVTENWDQYTFTFNYDETCNIHDSDTGIDYPGYWYIDQYWTGSDDDAERKQDLVFQVFDLNSENDRTFRWKEAYANNRKLQARETKNDGVYKFKLMKN